MAFGIKVLNADSRVILDSTEDLATIVKGSTGTVSGNSVNYPSGQGSNLFFMKSKNTRHNIFGLWSIDLLETLENDLINNNFRKVEEWANKIGVKTIDIIIYSYRERLFGVKVS